MSRLFQIPYAFVLMNWAAVVGLYRYLKLGKHQCVTIWTEGVGRGSGARTIKHRQRA